jgi:PKD repeat protein
MSVLLRLLYCFIPILIVCPALSQTITIDNAAFPTGVYGQGSTIAVPVKIVGCYNYNNAVNLYLCSPANPTGVQIGTYDRNGFFTTFVNGTIPAGTAPRNDYYVVTRTTAPVTTSAPSPIFQISATPGPVAFVNTVSNARRLVDGYFYGYCTPEVVAESPITLWNQSTADASVSFNYKDENSGVVTNIDIGPNGTPQILLSKTFYTFTSRAEKNGVISTRSVFLVNTAHFFVLGSTILKTCLPDFLDVNVVTSGPTSILNNFPGSYYVFEWGDGTKADTITLCALKSVNGLVQHNYLRTSCGRSDVPNESNAFALRAVYVNPYKNAPVSNCNDISFILPARVFQRPEARFTYPDYACITNPVTFTNTSIPGEAQDGAQCTRDQEYEWYVNDSLVSTARNLVYPFPVIGKYTVKLKITNTSCAPSEVSHEVCIEPLPVPEFKVNGLDSVISCDNPLTVNITNLTNSNPCRSNTWRWEVYNDSTGQLVSPNSGVYTITPSNTAMEPVFVFHVAGRYRVRLIASNSCTGTFRIDKIVHLSGNAVVRLPADKAYCNTDYTINFAVNNFHKPSYNSQRGDETYLWTVTGGAYSFVNGTTAADRYPQIRFTDIGTYTVRVQFISSCGQSTDVQQIFFTAPNTVVLPRDRVDTCYATVSLPITGIVTGPIDSVKWSGTGSGTFSVTNALSTIYTFSPADKAAGSVKLVLKAFAQQPSGCPNNTDTLLVVFFPENRGRDSVRTICNNTAVVYTPVSSVGGSTFSWTSVVTRGVVSGNTPSGTGSIGDVLVNDDPAMDGEVTYTITPFANGCTGVPYVVKAIVRAKPVVTIDVNDKDSICSNTRTDISMSSTVSGVSYSWTSRVVAGNVTGNSNGTNQPITRINDLLVNTGTTDATVEYTIRALLDGACSSDPQVVLIAILTGTTVASAGNDTVLCNELTAILTGNTPIVGTGTWLQVGGPLATIADPGSPGTSIEGLTAGNIYLFAWVIEAADAQCNGSRDTVAVRVLPPIDNRLLFPPRDICAGMPVDIVVPPATGGTGSYDYEWQSSTDNINFVPMPGAVLPGVSVSPAQTTWYRRVVKSLPCSSISDTIVINVAAGIANNTISRDQSICINQQPDPITGLVPTGGNSGYQFIWESSTNNINWSVIAGAIVQDYAPGTLTVTTYYRRRVNTVLCSGPYASISNVVKVTVNPDARALFEPLKTEGCNDFVIDAALINLTPFDDRNREYQWYVDGVLWSTGKVFRPYTMTEDGDTITIKLLTLSFNGCRNDSMEKVFITLPDPDPSFSKNKGEGCGPLKVTFTNTTPDAGRYRFLWNFGNGATSTAVQPVEITYASNRFYRDTTYYITLKTFNECDTLYFRDSVLVRPDPRAVFTVSKVIGCSPLIDTIFNLSPGNHFMYYLDYGDGHGDTLYSKGRHVHEYITGVIDTFKVKLTAFNVCGTHSDSIDVVVSPNTIQPAIVVDGSDLYGCAPHTAIFVNSSFGAAQVIMHYGDNSIPDTLPGTQNRISHQFTQPGVYNVRIQFINACSDTSLYRTVTVYASPVPDFSLINVLICPGGTVQTRNVSRNANAYEWVWGDGSSSTGPNPSHTYNDTGSYEVRLIARYVNNFGEVCSVVSQPAMVRVVGIIPARIDTVAAKPCVAYALAVTAAGARNAGLVEWWFYDTARAPYVFYATGVSASYQFNSPGTYRVKLIVHNIAGCKDSAERYFTVWPTPVAILEKPVTINTCNIDTMLTIPVRASYNGADPITFHWLINDKLSGVGTPFNYRFQLPAGSHEPATYVVRVLPQNAAGCGDTAYAGTLVIRPLLQPVIEVKPRLEITQPEYIFTFIDTVTRGVSRNYVWDFGDRSVKRTTREVLHEYGDTGRYQVKLQVYDEVTRCVRYDSVRVAVLYAPGYLYVPDAICTGCGVAKLRSFKPIGKGLSEYRLRIFNSYGQLIFESTRLDRDGVPMDAWDGHENVPNGRALQQDSYRWQIEARYKNKREWLGMYYPGRSVPMKTGFITVIK